MQAKGIPGAVLLLLLCSGTTLAQGDAPWWRSLFGQSDAQGQDEAEGAEDAGDADAHPAPDAEVERNGEGSVPMEGDGTEGRQAEGSGSAVGFELPPGSVQWEVSTAILGLDSLKQTADEVRIPGFRVQLFMGRLDSVRSLRMELLEDASIPFDVHLAPYPPLFGLQVGDFRTSLAAYRARRTLLGRFPDALVVPAELSPELAFPFPAGCVWTP